MSTLPQAVRTALWSYDIDALDLEHDKREIVLNILNFGTDEAVRWLFDTYSRTEIEAVFAASDKSAWTKKSLSFWSAIFNTTPANESRLSRIVKA